VSVQPGSPTSFDDQASEFDRRVGMPEERCRAIAAAVLELVGARDGGLVVEIGAGTGMIGRWFLEHPTRYVGLDLSRGMLEVFRRRADAALVQADAARPWPLPGRAADVVFSSRAIHLLPADHVVEELFRVAAPAGASCVLGWVERRPDSVKARLSREMQRRVRERGFPARHAGGGRLLDACRRRGAERLPKTVVERWPVRHAASAALRSWRAKQGLGGTVLPAGVQEEVLDELEGWALTAFGDLDAGFDSEEAYVLEGVRLPA
jgi:SAM-dependent methyltransferase